VNIDEVRMRIFKEAADTLLEISRVYNLQGKFELAALAQKFAARHLHRYAAYTKRLRRQAIG